MISQIHIFQFSAFPKKILIFQKSGFNLDQRFLFVFMAYIKMLWATQFNLDCTSNAIEIESGIIVYVVGNFPRFQGAPERSGEVMFWHEQKLLLEKITRVTFMGDGWLDAGDVTRVTFLSSGVVVYIYIYIYIYLHPPDGHKSEGENL